MSFLYLSADQIGAASGGGRVTQEESTALFDLATEQGTTCTILGRQELTHGIEAYGPEPWCWDKNALETIDFREDIQLAHFYAGTFSTSIQTLKRRTKIAYTAAAHDVSVSCAEHQKLGIPFNYPHLTDGALWNRYVTGYRQADVVICPSQHSAECMWRYGCERIEVIPHGCDLVENIVSPPKRFVLGYLGAVGPDKGLIYLLRAWQKLNYQDDSLLLLAGGQSDSSFIHSLIEAVFNLRQPDPYPPRDPHIRLLGWVKNVSDFYNNISLYVQPSVCLLPGTLVFSKRGPVAIDKLTEQDSVLVNTGHYRSVIAPLRNSYVGELICIKSIGVSESVAMTPAHRLLVIKRGLSTRAKAFRRREEICKEALRLRAEKGLGSLRVSQVIGIHPQTIESWFRGTRPHDGHCGALRSLREDVIQKQPQWIHAKDLEKGDVLLFPRIKKTVPRYSINLPKKVVASNTNRTKPLPDQLVLDAEAMQFFGYYVAEACNTKSSIIFCFHCDEVNYINDVRQFLKNRLGLKSRVSFHQHKNSATVRVESALLARFLAKHFGKGAHNKTFPTWALLLPEEQLVPLIRGAWRGDGTCWLVNAGRKGVSYSTVSKKLAYQMFAALVRLGYMPKLLPQRIGYLVSCHGNDSLRFAEEILGLEVKSETGKRGTRTHIDSDYYYMPVIDVSRIAYQGEVFNLEVEGKHNYCAPFVVHNSEGFGIEVLESLAHARPVLCSTGAGAADAVPETWRFPAADVDALADKIDQFRKADLELMGKVGRELAKEYTWPAVRKRYQDVWRNLLG